MHTVATRATRRQKRAARAGAAVFAWLALSALAGPACMRTFELKETGADAAPEVADPADSEAGAPDATVAEVSLDAPSDAPSDLPSDIPSDVPATPEASVTRYSVLPRLGEFTSPFEIIGDDSLPVNSGNCPMNARSSGTQMLQAYFVFDVSTADSTNYVAGLYNNYCGLLAADGTVTLPEPLILGGLPMGPSAGASTTLQCPGTDALVGLYGVLGRAGAMTPTSRKRIFRIGLVCAPLPAWLDTAVMAPSRRSALIGVTPAQMANVRDVEMPASICDRDQVVVGLAAARVDGLGAIKPVCGRVTVTR